MTVSMAHLAREATRARHAYQDALAGLREIQAEVAQGVRFEDIEPTEAALRDIADEVTRLEVHMLESEESVFWQLAFTLMSPEELEEL